MKVYIAGPTRPSNRAGRARRRSERMSDMDALVEKAASVHQFHGETCLCGFWSALARDRSSHIARAALLAVGLPALLERVEAAEGEARMLDWTSLNDGHHPCEPPGGFGGSSTTAIPPPSTRHLGHIRQLIGLLTKPSGEMTDADWAIITGHPLRSVPVKHLECILDYFDAAALDASETP